MTDPPTHLPVSARRVVGSRLNACRLLLREAVELAPHADEREELKALLAKIEGMYECYGPERVGPGDGAP